MLLVFFISIWIIIYHLVHYKRKKIKYGIYTLMNRFIYDIRWKFGLFMSFLFEKRLIYVIIVTENNFDLYIFLYMFNYHDLATSLDKSFLKGNVITSIVVIQITSCRVLKNLRYKVNLNIGAHNVNLGIFTVMTLL